MIGPKKNFVSHCLTLIDPEYNVKLKKISKKKYQKISSKNENCKQINKSIQNIVKGLFLKEDKKYN